MAEIIPPENSLLTNPLILYLKKKCFLPEEEIERKLIDCEVFDIKAEGNDLDTQLMEEVLRDNDFYEKLSQKQLREQAMKFIKAAVQKWSVSIAKNQKKINKQQLPNYIAKILPFGSYVLDLRSNNSDIDLICVVPNFISRDTHFFDGLADVLQEDPEVKGLSKRRNAQVPIITFDYKEINIDISYCRLSTESIPRDIERVITMDLLNSIEDNPSKTALLGRKNNLMILELAGSDQAENFKQTLRIIKVWAENRGISSNRMGFLGGISWAIMLAKVCQIFPAHKPAKLLSEFFRVYKLWRWKQMPVQLLKPEQPVQKSIMTVLTPGSPYNSTVRVNDITFEVISKEINRASEILDFQRSGFQTLCEKTDFMKNFQMFVEIDICGKGADNQSEKDFKDFQGSVEAKIIILLQKIINNNKSELQKGVLKIVPNPKIYKKKYTFSLLSDPIYRLCSTCLMGVKVTASVNLRKAVSEWCTILDKQRKQRNEQLNVRIFQCKKEDFESDLELAQAKKKDEIQDPRLALLAKIKS